LSDTAPRTDKPSRVYRPPEVLRLLFFAILGMWLLVPVLLRDNLAQDAIPYVVAGELVRTDPDLVYAAKEGDLFELEPVFAKRSCEIAPPGTDCPSLSVAFVSTPFAIPCAVAVAQLGPDAGVLAMRVLAALSLAGGMWVLWNRLAHRTRTAPQQLVFTALLLTPFTMVSLSLGQTSPVLFASAALGISRADRWLRAILTAGLWVAAVALKAFPAALFVVLVLQRRWRLVVSSVGWGALLGVLALALGPISMWTGFVETAGDLSAQAGSNPYNGSLDALAYNLVAPLTESTGGSGVLFGVRVALAAGLFWWSSTRLDDDAQWAYAYVLVLLVVPLVWWHYLWLAVAAVGIALAARRRLDDRTLAVLPVLAAVTVPISIPNSRGWSIPVAQGFFLLATVVLVPLLSGGFRRPARSARGDGEPVPQN